MLIDLANSMNNKDFTLGFTTLLCFMNHKLEHANLLTQMIGLEGLQIEIHLRLLSSVTRLAETTPFIYFYKTGIIKAIGLSNQKSQLKA